MTEGTEPGGDPSRRRLDAAIRAAAERPVDEARLTQQVLARVRTRRKPIWPAIARGGALAPAALAAYALVLVATPFVVARVPLGEFDPVADIALTAALGGGELPALLSRGLDRDGAGG